MGGAKMNGAASVSMVEEAIAVITLHHGKVNALSRVLVDDLAEALESLQGSPARVVLLRAQAGARIFSAGYDVRELPRGGTDLLRFAAPLRRVMQQIEELRQPVIALVEGSVWGGACELVFNCDLIVTGEETTFAFTPAKLGIPYDLQGMRSVAGAGGSLLKEMLFLAQPIAAARLEACGIVNRVVPGHEIETCAMEMARTIARNSPLVLHLLKEELRSLAESGPLKAETQAKLQVLRQRVYESGDYGEGIEAFLDKRSPKFRGE